jgi:thioredoxin reductase (NADPH)
MPTTATWRPAGNMPDQASPSLYPILPDHLLHAIASRATCTCFQPGEQVFPQGRRNAPFYVIEQGRVVFFDRNLADPDEYFASVSTGMFIGDLAMFTGEPTIAECRALEPTRVLTLTIDQLRQLIRENAEAGDLILKTFMARRDWLEGQGLGQIQILGPGSCPGTYALRDFLGRNQIPFVWRDPETQKDARLLVEQFNVAPKEFPILIREGNVHRNPQLRSIAACIGLLPELKDEPYDLAVVGAGPGGLAAAVYGASEGLDTLVLDASAPGGQAATSSKIENYLGFTTGISGKNLAREAVLQARKFGATLASPACVQHIDCQGDHKTLTLDDNRTIKARAVILAMGARYRRLDLEQGERFEGVGLYYAAGHLEAVHCSRKPVVVVGGGNSAGQAAVFLSQHASKVHIVIRRDSLADTMSDYLIQRIHREPNIELITRSEIAALHGGNHLEAIDLASPQGNRGLPCAALFVMIGAEPRTDWLRDCCTLDEKGFILTGRDALAHPEHTQHWTLHGSTPDREPDYLETSRPGIFAVGDTRSGSVKRVATAVGEGAMAIALVHRFLQEHSRR